MENNDPADYRKEPDRPEIENNPVPPPQPPRPGENKPAEKRGMNFWNCCAVVAVAIVIMITLTTCSLFSLIGAGFESAVKSGSDFGDDAVFENAKHLQGPKKSKRIIAVINIKGVILSDANSSFESANSAKICRLIRTADKEPKVAAILLYLDTPGGEVTASDEIWNAVRKARKPVIAYMGSMAASGGYYIAAGADKIIAHRTTLTGSIGVIIQALNYHTLIRRLGIESQVYTSGKMKAMLHGGKETTKEEKTIVQDLVMSSYKEFVRVVSEGRKIPYDKLYNSSIADGRILDGKQALKAGLVDMNGYFEDAVKVAEKMGKVPEGTAKVLLMKPQTSFMDFLMEFRSALEKPQVNVNLPGSREFQLSPGKAYYLPAYQ